MKRTKHWLVLMAFAFNCLVLNAADHPKVSWKVVQFTLPNAKVAQPYRTAIDEYLKTAVGAGFGWNLPDRPKFLQVELPLTLAGTPRREDRGFHSFLILSELNSNNTPTIAKFYLTVDEDESQNSPPSK